MKPLPRGIRKTIQRTPKIKNLTRIRTRATSKSKINRTRIPRTKSKTGTGRGIKSRTASPMGRTPLIRRMKNPPRTNSHPMPERIKIRRHRPPDKMKNSNLKKKRPPEPVQIRKISRRIRIKINPVRLHPRQPNHRIPRSSPRAWVPFNPFNSRCSIAWRISRAGP